MRLVTFEDRSRRSWIGALTPQGLIIDLNTACSLYLRDVEKESAFYRIAEARVPPDMRLLFEGGDQSLQAAARAFQHAQERGERVTGPSGEPVFYRREEITLRAPIKPKKFFHTAGNFREHHEDAQKAGFSHPILPWIVFFQNVDAIIGPEESIVYPEHLTQELDYELELALVLKKAGKHFDAAQAMDYIG